MIVSRGDLSQREAVKRLKWFEFYMTMRLLKERNDREDSDVQQRAKELRLKNNSDGTDGTGN